jgi:hypothetical protein
MGNFKPVVFVHFYAAADTQGRGTLARGALDSHRTSPDNLHAARMLELLRRRRL